MRQSGRPELLAPAGSLEKLKVAIGYGADAVYLAGQKYGLREACDNFNHRQLEQALALAHRQGVKVYVALNAFLHDADMNDLPSFLSFLERLKVDAIIVSDMGVISAARRHSLPIHLSTQASCANLRAANVYRRLGVKRLILGREVSVADAAKIKDACGLEVELFVHGSQCVAYSGNCVISNYTRGRDANRGGCAHSCRFLYQVNVPAGHSREAHFMSSKDLSALSLLPRLVEAQIDGLKIEGRMKGPYYVGTVTKVYAEALRDLARAVNIPSRQWQRWQEELQKVSHREYYEGSLSAPAGEDSLCDERRQEESAHHIAAVVLEVCPQKHLLVQVRSAFRAGDALELMPFTGPARRIDSSRLRDVDGQSRSKTRPGTLALLPWLAGARRYNLIRNNR